MSFDFVCLTRIFGRDGRSSERSPLRFLILLLLLVSSPLPAQRVFGPATGELTLDVIDKAGLKLPGAAIDVKSETGINRSTISDREGRASFKSLPVGKYQATVRLAGFGILERTNIQIAPNASTAIRVTLDDITNLGIHYARPKATADSKRITEITIRRTECFGECPVYTTTLRSDGTATSVGDEHSPLPGTWKGECSSEDFNELALLATKIGYFSLESHYEYMITDNPSVITSVVRDGVRKTVSNYARSAPLTLEGFEEAIDVVAARCEMELVKEK